MVHESRSNIKTATQELARHVKSETLEGKLELDCRIVSQEGHAAAISQSYINKMYFII